MVRLICCLVVLCAGAVSPAFAQPKLETDSFQIDLGAAKAGTVIERAIPIRNAGTEPLVIEKAQTSCPCTTVALSEGADGVVAPGETLALQLRYDTEDRHGAYGATLVVHSNDPGQPIAAFEIGVVITKAVVTDPPDVLAWGLAPRGSAVDKTLSIRAGDPTLPIELVELSLAEEGLSADAVHEIENGQERIVATFTLAPDVPLGVHKNEATIRVRIEEQEHLLRLPIQGGVLGDVLITPPAIISPRLAYKAGEKISEITVQSSTGTGDIRVVGAPATGPIETAFRNRDEGEGFVIE
ncbi:MAG: DUF1573 domain-containing protein, partial [Candidatus Hydrogenedentales bacterium]